MAISTETRRAGPFTGNGAQREFPFAFKVFSADQVKVVVAGEDEAESTLAPSAYAVSLESDQDGSPGGIVTLNSPLAAGSVLAILSAVPMLQPMVLTNRGGFYPATLNDSADRAVILAQQLSERLDRAVTVDATDVMTPSELKQKLLDAATDATVVAKGYAEAAKASAEAAAESASSASSALAGLDAKAEEQIKALDAKAEEQIKALDAKAEEQIKALEEKGAEQVGAVEAEGDKQVRRIEAAAEDALVLEGLGGAEGSWILSADVSAGTSITIADGHQYVVGRHHLRVSWNGVVLYLEKNFTELGTVDKLSSTFALTFDAKAGDELDVWVAPLGKKDVADAIATAKAAEEAVAELSRKVVYKDQESAGE